MNAGSPRAAQRAVRRAEMLDTVRANGGLVTPDDLPIAQVRAELLTAIAGHQVVIVAGETGSGKSTQLPKLCVEAGRGIGGMIGHTQPRRVAARTIAERIATELGGDIGGAVGYTVRFTDHVQDHTLIKVMTDGILLAEIQRDRWLRAYDTIIVDEAHERSLNIDFLLGYLHQLLPQRPDLKLIVTSATIDTSRFSAHFDDAPVVEVSGRSFPVELRYRPIGEDPGDDRDQVQAVCDAIDELSGEGPGDVLVFLSGEREIHDVADTLRRREPPRFGLPVEVLPLYARLSAAEQHRVFEPHTGRRVVLSTNVAETSLTVPGVRYVVDAGSARISRYSHRLKVQRLPIEPVSRASADQRAGRCGRVAPGICIRLYGEDDFLGRPEFGEPEILRTNLASVILQMIALRLGDVDAFPFLDPPDARSIRDGTALLVELGAIEPDEPGGAAWRMTGLGGRLARLPVDPRLGRMVLEAERHGCVREVMVIAAALSIQDPRERPAEHAQAADDLHRRFAVDGSDVLTLVKLWDHVREREHALTNNQFRKLCRAEHLNYLRIREWQDLFSQIRQVAGSLGIHQGADAGPPDRVHQAVLSGMLSHLGMRDDTQQLGVSTGAGRPAPRGRQPRSAEYRGAHGARFAIGRGSVVAKAGPRWVVAAELVETNRLWGRMVATVQPEWAERISGHLARRSFGDPRWDHRRGGAVVTERVTLYGLPIVAGRTVGYDRVDPEDARRMFIRHALVDGEWETTHEFDRLNREFLAALPTVEGRLRRVDLTDDDTIVAFFDQRLPSDVVTARHFDRWWRDQRAREPDLLTLTVEALTGAEGTDLADFPTIWRVGGLDLTVSYRFDASHPHDGVTVHVPLAALGSLSTVGFDRLVAGWRGDLIDALIRTLPKAYRKEMVPLGDTIAATTRRVDELLAEAPDTAAFVTIVSQALTEVTSVIVPPDLLDASRLAPHLRVSFAVVGEDGGTLATSKDLATLQREWSGTVRRAIAAASPVHERDGITRWDLGDLPQQVEVTRQGVVVPAYPTLVDDGDSVSLRVVTNPDLQGRAMRAGLRRLVLIAVPVSRRAAERDLSPGSRLSLATTTWTIDDIIRDATVAAASALLDVHGEDVWTEAAFMVLVDLAREELADRTAVCVRRAVDIVDSAARLNARLDRLVTPALQPSVDDLRAQLQRLVRPGFAVSTGAERLGDVARYLDAAGRRLDKLPEDPRRDQARMHEVHAIERRYAAYVNGLARSAITADVIDLGWQVEELRVSVFAPAIKTPRTVSVQRLTKELVRRGG